MIGECAGLPKLDVPVEWVKQQLSEHNPPFFVEDKEQHFRLFSPSKETCWFIFRDDKEEFVLGKGSQAIHTFAKDFFTGKIAAHGWSYMKSRISLSLSESEVECLEDLKGEKGVIQNWGHYYHRNIEGFLFRGMIAEYFPNKHITITRKIRKKKKVANKLIETLARIHSKGIIHRDIKLRNIFLNSKGNPVIADFGYACCEGSRLTKVFMGTVITLSPELMKYFKGEPFEVSQKGDVWAMAVCIYELLFRNFPDYLDIRALNNCSNEKLFNNPLIDSAIKKMRCFSQSIVVKKDIHLKIQKMFTFEEADRPDMKEVLLIKFQQEEVKPLDKEQQIAIIGSSQVVFKNGRMRPNVFF